MNLRVSTTAVCFLCSGFALLPPTLAQSQELLGMFSAGSFVKVELERPITPTLLKVLIDGEELAVGWHIVGNHLQLTLPQNLSGQRHDLVLILDKPGQPEVIGSWVFDTPAKGSEIFVSLVTEVGSVASDTDSDEYASVAGRMDFALGGGRYIGGASFGYPDEAGIQTPADLLIYDLFLQYQNSVFGDDLYTRFGTHYIINDTSLIDDATHRGVSLRLEDLSNRYQIAVFALTPATLEGVENLSGLEDPTDLVVGTYGYVFPFAGNSTRLSFAGYQGNTTLTPDGAPGSGEGYGLTLTHPLAEGRADVALGVEASNWETSIAEHSGKAILLELDYELLPDEQRNLGVSFDYRWVDQDHYSFLNPSQILGEQGAVVGLHYYVPEWQWQLELGYATTNYHGDPTAPTDALADLSAQAFYLPDDFTGGFLNGATFYAMLDILAQDRLTTPLGAIDPQDNTFYSAIVGFDKFHRDYSLAISYRHDVLDDRTALDEDELTRRIEFLYSATPSEYTEFRLSSEIGHVINSAGSYWDGALGLLVSYEFAPEVLTLETGFGFADFENPTLDDGLYFEQSLLWEFIDGYNLVLNARYGEGTDVHSLVDGDEGWTFGVGLRTEFAFARIR